VRHGLINSASRRILLVILVGALLPAAPGTARPVEKSLAPGLARVDSLLAADNLTAGRDLARSLAGSTVGNSQFHWQFRARLGLALLRLDDAEGAVPHLEYAVRAAPDNPTNHRNLAAALVALGRRGRALSEYESAVLLAPGSYSIRKDYGQVLLEFRNYEDARIQLETANHLCDGCDEMRVPLARLYLGLGQPERAVPLLQALYAEAPDLARRRTLVQALQGANQTAPLVDLLATVPPADLGEDEYLALLSAEFQLGRLDRALALVAVTVQEGAGALDIPDGLKSRADFWGTLSYNLLVAEHFLPALQASDRAVELAPDNFVYRNNRIVLLGKLGRHEAARREMETLEKLKQP